MNTLAKELEDLEARRVAGTISQEDADLAKRALLQRGQTVAGEGATGSDAPRRGLIGWILAGVLANFLLSLAVLGGLAAIAYWLLPPTLAVPAMICLVLILPVLWLLEWLGDLF